MPEAETEEASERARRMMDFMVAGGECLGLSEGLERADTMVLLIWWLL